MPLIQDTAYPRLEACPSVAELACFTPTPTEMAFVTSRTRRAGPRLALLVLLKTFQRLGYFLTLEQVPAPIVEHLAHAAGLTGALDALPDYDGSTYRVRLMALVRVFVGVTSDGHAVRRTAVRASVEAARARDEIADIINAAIEELVRQRFELPAFGTLLKIAGTARAAVNRGYHRQVAGALAADVRQRLNDLLVLPPGQRRTAWDRVKTEPKQPTPRHMQGPSGNAGGGTFCDTSTGCAIRVPVPQCSQRFPLPRSASSLPRRASSPPMSCPGWSSRSDWL